MSNKSNGTSADQNEEKSRYVTVFHQLKETEHAEPGDRSVAHGKETDDRYILDEEKEGFIPVARAIAVIDAGVEMTLDEMSEWCNSDAGRAALHEYFPEIEPRDTTLPDMDEYMEAMQK